MLPQGLDTRVQVLFFSLFPDNAQFFILTFIVLPLFLFFLVFEQNVSPCYVFWSKPDTVALFSFE
jgi:hypothetical protein